MPYVTYRLSKVLLYRIFRIAKAQKNAAGPTEALQRHPRNFSVLGEVIFRPFWIVSPSRIHLRGARSGVMCSWGPRQVQADFLTRAVNVPDTSLACSPLRLRMPGKVKSKKRVDVIGGDVLSGEGKGFSAWQMAFLFQS